jgi:tetratricopeptide (TPR) repeat protein
MVNNTFNHRWKAHLFSAYAFLETGNDKKAGGEFESAVKWAPDKGECHWLMGRYFKEKREIDKAVKSLDKALEYKPEDKNILLDRASLCRILEDSKEEIRILERLFDIGNDDMEILFRLANLYLYEGKHKKSIEIYKKILAAEKNHSGALINMGLAWRKLKCPDKAIDYLNDAVKISPFSIEAGSNLAYAYYESMDFTSARKLFGNVSQINNDLEDIHLHLAAIYLTEGEIEACVTECDNVLRILNLPRNEVINGISDIKRQFIKIGDRFKTSGKNHLASLAFSMAEKLTPVSA